jgi:hypothetical protein
MTDADLDALLVRAFGPLPFGELAARRAQFRQALADYTARFNRALAEYTAQLLRDSESRREA